MVQCGGATGSVVRLESAADDPADPVQRQPRALVRFVSRRPADPRSEAKRGAAEEHDPRDSRLGRGPDITATVLTFRHSTTGTWGRASRASSHISSRNVLALHLPTSPPP